MALSEDSKRPNTSYIERTNLRSRMTCAWLRRREPAPAPKPEKVAQALERSGVICDSSAATRPCASTR